MVKHGRQDMSYIVGLRLFYEKKSFIFITVCRYDSIVCLF